MSLDKSPNGTCTRLIPNVFRNCSNVELLSGEKKENNVLHEALDRGDNKGPQYNKMEVEGAQQLSSKAASECRNPLLGSIVDVYHFVHGVDEL